MRHQVKRETLANARRMRQGPTAFEKRLWRRLVELHDEGHHFRRQVPFRGFILDFAEHGAKIAIELDGSQHDAAARSKRDHHKDALLKREGYLVVRLDNGEIAETVDHLIDLLQRALAERKPSPPTRNAARSDLPTRGRFIWNASRKS